MLQVRNTEPLARFSDTRSTAMSPGSTAMSPGDLLTSLNSLARRRFGILVLIFSLSVMCGAIYLYVTPPKFLGQATILIDSRKPQPFQQQQTTVSETSIDSPTVESQIEVLKSEAVAAAVVKQLHLTTDPEFTEPKRGLFGTILGFLTQSAPPTEADLQQRAEDVFRSKIVPAIF